MTTLATTPRTSFSALKPAALILAGLLAGSLFSEMLRPAAAIAQTKGDTIPPENLLNAAEQRKQLNTAINQVNERLNRIEGMLSTGIKVKVTEMPPVTMKDAGK